MRRILILSPTAHLGGAETSLLNLLRFLDSRDCEVHLGIWDTDGPLMERLPANVKLVDVRQGPSAKLYSVPSVRANRRARDVFSLARSFAVAGYFALERLAGRPYLGLAQLEGRYDVAVAFKHRGFAPYFLIDHVRSDKKVMWFHHGVYEPSPVLKAPIEKKYFEAMDAIVAVSYPLKDHLTAHFPHIADKFVVVGNLLDFEEIRVSALESVSDMKIPTGVSVLVTVSRLAEEKGIDIAVKAAELLRDRGHEFVWYFIGDGPQHAQLKRQILEAGLANRVLLLGSRVNPFPYVARSHIYVQPSRVEAEGLAIREAMALGRPIVASDLPPIAQALGDGEFGLTCTPTADRLAATIGSLMVDDERQRELSRRLNDSPWTNRLAEEALDVLFGLGKNP